MRIKGFCLIILSFCLIVMADDYLDYVNSFSCIACKNQSLINSQEQSAVNLRSILKDKFYDGANLKSVKLSLEKKYGPSISSVPDKYGKFIFLWLFPIAVYMLLLSIFFLFKKKAEVT